MKTFIVRENIRHFRERLEAEADPSIRSRLQKFLVEEEDKLGRNSETLCLIDGHISDGKMRVKKQQALVASEGNGHDTANAVSLLNSLNQTLLLFESFRQAIEIEIDRSSLND
jgi:hypothetical protein